MVLPLGFADAKPKALRLSERTSFRIGGIPEFFFEPESEEEAGEIVRACRRERIPLRVLGGGSNLLVADGTIEGAVLATGRIRFQHVFVDRVEVGAGTSFPGLVAKSADLGIPRLSGCPGIPGSVGGAVAMNAGGKFGCVADALLLVRGFDADGRPFSRTIEAGDMGYRSSVFQGSVVTAAGFARDPRLDRTAERARFSEAVAWKKATQPLSAASAGCVFKNPTGKSAGALIDSLGLKGDRFGHALVSPVHANFIVNEGGATFSDVFGLISRIRDRVHAAAGLSLDLEVKVWR